MRGVFQPVVSRRFPRRTAPCLPDPREGTLANRRILVPVGFSALANRRRWSHSTRVSYTVFARKYRPQTFDDVVGQQHITQTLKNAILQNRLAHAYLFVGPRGTGKTSTARILAKALNCLASGGPTLNPCGQCDSCVEVTAGNSMDVLEFDAASNTQVDKVRDIIIDNVKYLPARARFKIYLVDEVHMLSTGSFNALLKTLEEPPAHVKFLFATTDVQKLPATILSRCQRFDLKRIGPGVIAGHLLHIARQEGIALSQEAALSVAIGADGGMRDAESMLDQLVAFCGDAIEEKDVLSVFGFTSRQKVSDLCEAVLAEDSPGALQLVHEQAEAGRDLTQLLSDLIGHLRNLLLAQADPEGLADELGRPTVEALRAQGTGVARERLLELIDLCAAGEQRMKWASDKRMYLEVTLLRAIQTIGQVTLGEVLEGLKALKEGGALPERVKTERRQKVTLPASTPPLQSPVEIPKVAPRAVKPQAQAAGLPQKEHAGAESSAEVVPLLEAVEPAAAPASDKSVSAMALEQVREEERTDAGLFAREEPLFGTESRLLDRAPDEGAGPHLDENALVGEQAADFVASELASPGPASGAHQKALDVESIWPAFVERVREQKPFIAMWVESGVLAEIRGDEALFVFEEQQSLAADYIGKGGNREFLEALLGEITGVPLKVCVELRDSVQRRPVAQPPPPPRAVPKDPMEEFKDDPLIRKALEIFKARLESVH
jgi:DNA polymerase-3 subunit gamma/tau